RGEHPIRLVAPQHVDDAALLRLRALTQRHRLEEAHCAEADVRDPWLTIDHDAQQHVRAYPSFRRTAAHAAEEQADVVVEVAKRRGQQRVVLEAVAAAALIDEL